MFYKNKAVASANSYSLLKYLNKYFTHLDFLQQYFSLTYISIKVFSFHKEKNYKKLFKLFHPFVAHKEIGKYKMQGIQKLGKRNGSGEVRECLRQSGQQNLSHTNQLTEFERNLV